MFLVSRVDLVAPFPRPPVQIVPSGEGAPGQEVSLNEAEGAFYTPRAVRVPNCMRNKLKTEPLAERGHLRHGHHLASAAAQHDHMRVVDHHASRGAPHIAQSIGEKHLAIETLEGRIALEKQHSRVAEHRRGGLHLAFFASQSYLVRRGVVLEFLPGAKSYRPAA